MKKQETHVLKKGLLFCLMIVFYCINPQVVNAQSTIPQRDLWTIGNNIIKFDPITGALQTGIGTLPLLHPTTIANGWQPDPNNFTISNSYHDENGDLLFFISDSKVYDWEGRFIGALAYLPGNAVPVPGGDGTSTEPIHGHKEIAIVPDKCNPRVFYIVAGDRLGNGHNARAGSPKYTKLELGLNINTINVDGTINSISGDPLADGRLGFANDYFAYQVLAPYVYVGAPMHSLVNNLTGTQDEPFYSYAVSKVQADGVRLLFVGTGSETSIFSNVDLATAGSIDQLSSPSPIYTDIQFGNQNPNVEFELFQASGSSNIRFANKHPNGFDYFYEDFTYSAGNITVNPLVILHNTLYTGEYGLEFSPNGQYLYFTHNTGFAYFDLTQVSPTVINVATSQINISNFNTSQIEVGKDNALYFCNGPQLGRLTNINNPSLFNPGNFATINLPNLVSKSATINGINAGVQTLAEFVYTFNDQVDGEPAYPVIPVGNTLAEAKCCIERKKYDADVYNVGLANGITFNSSNHNQVWSPGALNNPFSSVSGVVAIKNRLIIPAGYTVTINNMTFEYKIFIDDPINTTVFVDGAKCILERAQTNAAGNVITLNGGTLILNNSIFKSIYSCEGMWDGIEVQGCPNAPQQVITTGPLNIRTQARLIINSGSVIQDAYFGAANYQFDLTNGNGIFFETPLASSGGIIIANNSTFKNNFIGTIFLPYSTANVISKFTNTNFLVDAPLKNSLITPLAMSFLLGNKNLPFTSCNFKNLIASPNSSPYPIVPASSAVVGLHGILSFDATFTVKGGLSVGVPFGTGCTFENLAYGIRAFNWTANTALVQSSTFINNWRGSYFGNYSGTSVTKTQRNKYYVNTLPYGTAAIDAAYGHYLDYCNNFIVQENRFYYNGYNEGTGAPVSGQFNAYGLIVNEENSGAGCQSPGYKGDEVYKNLFKEINIGSQNQGSNTEKPANAQTLLNGCNGNTTANNQGLKYVCNTYAGTDENDITVVPNSQNGSAGRIAYQQGVISAPAGNVFSHVGSCSSFMPTNGREIYIDYNGIGNNNPNYLNYTHQNTLVQTPNCFSPVQIAPTSILGNPSTVPNTGAITTAVNYANTCPTKINTLPLVTNISLFRSLGKTADIASQPLLAGDAETLMTVIATSNSGQIQNTLQPKSPYLSDRVLLALINSNVSNGVLKNILIANSPLSPKVKAAFLALNLPNGIKNQINSAQVGDSPRELLEAQVTTTRDSRHTYGIEAMHQLLSDTAIVVTDSIIKLSEELGGSETHCERLKIYTAVKDTLKARQQSELMAATGEVDVVCTFLMKLSAAYSKYNVGALGVVKDSETMDAIYAARVENSAADSRGAEGVLQAFRKNPYTEWVQAKNNTSVGARMTQTADEESIKTVQNQFIKLYPNPSIGLFNYELLDINSMTGDYTMEIYNSVGAMIKRYTINKNDIQGSIDLTEFSNGIYFINIINSNRIILNTKLSVVK